MRKILLPVLLLTLLLAGCDHTPQPSPTPAPTDNARVLQTTWLKVDADHHFWVTLQETDEPSPITEAPVDNGSTFAGLRVNLYRNLKDAEPVQSFLTGYNCLPLSLKFHVGDWDFDGYPDLSFTNVVIGSRYNSQDFYLWDPETKLFIPDPYGLNKLNYPEHHQDDQVITSRWPIPGGSETYRHYRYEAGELTLTRECQKTLVYENSKTGTYSYSVEGLMNGTWQALFHGESDPDDITALDASEYLNWRDQFDYPPTLWGFPIDAYHDAFEVPTGGKLGTVLVTVEVGKPLYDGTLNTFSVWSKDDLTTPIQQMEAEAYQVLHGHDVVDANFDGYTDFSYICSWGTGGEFRHYYLWNETAGQFVSVPELTEYGHVGFDAETETVVGYVKSGFAGLDGWEDILRWENGSLVCCRRINRNPYLNADDTITVEITVSDHINGELTEVFFVKSNEVDCWDEIMKWEDLNYHG